MKADIRTALIALVVSLAVSLLISLSGQKDIWKETAIKSLSEANQYRAMIDNNTKVVNSLIEELRGLNNNDVNRVLDSHGAK